MVIFRNTFDNSSTAIIEEIIRCYEIDNPGMKRRTENTKQLVELVEHFMSVSSKKYKGVSRRELAIMVRIITPMFTHYTEDFMQDVFKFRNKLEEIQATLDSDMYF